MLPGFKSPEPGGNAESGRPNDVSPNITPNHQQSKQANRYTLVEYLLFCYAKKMLSSLTG